MQSYECVIVFSTDLAEEAIGGEIKKVESIVANHKGTVTKTDLWGRKPLAYKIRKKDYGFYVVLVLEAEGTMVADLDRQLRINDTVLRHLIVAKDKYSPDLSQRLRDQTDDFSRDGDPVDFLPGDDQFAPRM